MRKYFDLARFQLRKKSNIIVAIIIGILSSVAILISTYQVSWKNYLENDVYDTLMFKRLMVQVKPSEENLNTLNNINHVSYVTYMAYYNEKVVEVLNLNNKSGNIIVNDANNDILPDIVLGKKFINDNDYYMVCPQKFTFSTSSEKLKKYSKNKLIDLSNYLNKDIELKYYGKNKQVYKTKVKLVGLYKNSEFSYDEDTCYVNRKVKEEIVKNIYKDVDNYTYEEAINNLGYILTIDNAKNLSYVKNELDNLGFFYQDMSFINTDSLNEKNQDLNFAIVVILILLFIFIYFMFQKDFKEDLNYYKLLYKLGYNKKNIKITYFISLILKTLIYLVFIILLSLVFCLVLKIVLYNYPFLLDKYRIIYNFKYMGIILLIIIFNVVLNNIINIRKTNLKW